MPQIIFNIKVRLINSFEKFIVFPRILLKVTLAWRIKTEVQLLICRNLDCYFYCWSIKFNLIGGNNYAKGYGDLVLYLIGIKQNEIYRIHYIELHSVGTALKFDKLKSWAAEQISM